jgi:hypothetical protein
LTELNGWYILAIHSQHTTGDIKMGYRSDVAIKVYGKVENMVEFKKAYDDIYTALSLESKAFVNSLIECSQEFDFTHDTFTFAIRNYKWYDGYPEVDFINSLTRVVDDLDLNIDFVQIGEDSDDVEEYHYGENVEYRIGISRTIYGLDDD